MTKQELKKADNNEVIRESIRTFGFLMRDEAIGRGTKQLEKHFKDCGEELVKRELLTEYDWKALNA